MPISSSNTSPPADGQATTRRGQQVEAGLLRRGGSLSATIRLTQVAWTELRFAIANAARAVEVAKSGVWAAGALVSPAPSGGRELV